MLGSAPQAAAPHEFAVVHAEGVGLVPHHAQFTPLTGVQLTNVSAFSWVEQLALVHDRSTWVNPVSVVGVVQLGNVLVLRVLVLTMLTVVVIDPPETNTSGPGGGPPGVQFCPWLGESTIAPLARVVQDCPAPCVAA